MSGSINEATGKDTLTTSIRADSMKWEWMQGEITHWQEARDQEGLVLYVYQPSGKNQPGSHSHLIILGTKLSTHEPLWDKPHPNHRTIHLRGKNMHTQRKEATVSAVLFCGFLPTLNHGLKVLNGKFQEEIILCFNFHAVPSHMAESCAILIFYAGHQSSLCTV
jgi:hypothetical protein